MSAEYTLYFNRLSSTEAVVTPSPTASIDPKAVGALEARGYQATEHQIEMVVLRFEDASGHEAAADAIEALGWAEGHQFDLAGSGPMLLLVRAPESAGDKEDTIDELLGAFAGEE